MPPRGPNLSLFDLNISNATVSNPITIHIKVNSSNPGGTKLNVSCGGVSTTESAAPEFYSTWNTSGCGAASATVTVYSRDVSDPNWLNPSVSSKSVSLSAVQTTVSVPTASFSADSTSILQGQCTYLHWATSAANSVDIDGSTVSSSGETQVCPAVTKKYTLTAHGQEGDANRNVTIVVTEQVTSTPQPVTASVASEFQTGNIINIGGNIFVIVGNQRRLVPNPDTLDALGISRTQINNRGYSDSDLNTIPRGADIPDVDRDYSGFKNFKNSYFPSALSIPTATPLTSLLPKVTTPLSPKASNQQNLDQTSQDTSFQGQQEPTESSESWLCQIIPSLCDFNLKASDINCKPQCVTTAYLNRQDMNKWVLPTSGHLTTPEDIYNAALKSEPFFWDNQWQIVQVTTNIQENELIIWPVGCQKVPEPGHIGMVKAINGGTVDILDSNWNTPDSSLVCAQGIRKEIPIQSCWKYISNPIPITTPALTTPITSNSSPTTEDKCVNPTGWNIILCKLPWLK